MKPQYSKQLNLKIFSGFWVIVEKEVQDWLREQHCSIVHILQTGEGQNITLTVFYLESIESLMDDVLTSLGV